MYSQQLMALMEAKTDGIIKQIDELKSYINSLKQANVSMLWMLRDIESFLRNNGYDTRLVREAIRQNGSAEWGAQMLAEQKRLVTEHRDLLKACKMLLGYVESDYDHVHHGAASDEVAFARNVVKNAEETE